MPCPTCQASARPRPQNEFFPFCSRACKLADLGRWLDGDYRITAASWDEEVAEPTYGVSAGLEDE